MRTKRRICIGLLLTLSWATVVFPQSPSNVQFLTFEQAEPIVKGMKSDVPTTLASSLPLTSTSWSSWLNSEDQVIRGRLDRGQEDTLTNLLRFGVTYTKEYRIDDQYLLKYGQSSLVNAFAETRANDLIKAMTSGTSNEGIQQMRAFLEKQGFSFKTATDRQRIKQYLLANLARMRDDVARYIKTEDTNRFELFEDRGISLDSNLWPDFLIDQHLQSMLHQGLLRPNSIRRVAIVGPGLDFANKEKGNDFYPPQTIQPFAVLDSLIRLGLTSRDSVEIYTLDISPEVNFHIERARKNAARGQPYIIQLPWNSSARLAPDYRASFEQYWKKLGDAIGQPVPAILVPAGAAAETQTRAIKIPPQIVELINPLDTNIVFQHLTPPPDQRFDLIIGTNIFVYFNNFEQALARKNMSLMLKHGGFVLSNDKLPGTPSDGLADSLQTTLVIARDPDRTDYMFTYRYP